MGMKLYNYLAGKNLPELTPVDKLFLLNLVVRCDDEGHILFKSKALAFSVQMDRGNLSRKMNELVAKGVLDKTDGAFVVSKTIVEEAKLCDGQPGVVVEGTTQVVSTTLPFPPHPLTPNKNIKNTNQDYSIDPPIIPPPKTNTACDLSRTSWEAARLGYSASAKAYRSPTGRPDFITQGVTMRPSLMSHIRNARQTYSKEQLAFVHAYPKTESDPAAFLEAWGVVIESGVKGVDLVRAAKDYAEKMTYDKDDGTFIQTPENWLTRKGYAVYVRRYEEERAQRRRSMPQTVAAQDSDIADFDPFDTTGFNTDKE